MSSPFDFDSDDRSDRRRPTPTGDGSGWPTEARVLVWVLFALIAVGVASGVIYVVLSVQAEMHRRDDALYDLESSVYRVYADTHYLDDDGAREGSKAARQRLAEVHERMRAAGVTPRYPTPPPAVIIDHTGQREWKP